MSQADPFASPKLRVSCAEAQIEDLDGRLRAFFASVNVIHVVEKDNEGDDVVKVRLDKQFPDDLSFIASQAVESLRAALDNTAFATAEVSGKPDAKSAHFPIADDAAGLENVINRRCRDIPPAIVTFFRSLKPYKGGNDAIWSLNKMCNASKHRFIVPVGKKIGPIQFTGFSMTASATGFANMMMPKWDTEKDEMILFISSSDSKIEGDFRLSYNVVFGKVKPVAGNEIFAVLRPIAQIVEGTVFSIEKECRRIGLIN